MDEFSVERLDRGRHQCDDFSCGKAPLDDFLKTLVGQYEKRRLGKTFVLVRLPDTRVLGYYTLASGSIPFAHLPAKIAKKLPKHPIPVILLARLALDQSLHGKGMGDSLLTDALKRVLELAKNVGVFTVEVDAIDKVARSFYLKYGFVPLNDSEFHLYLPVSAFEQEYSK